MNNENTEPKPVEVRHPRPSIEIEDDGFCILGKPLKKGTYFGRFDYTERDPKYGSWYIWTPCEERYSDRHWRWRLLACYIKKTDADMKGLYTIIEDFDPALSGSVRVAPDYNTPIYSIAEPYYYFMGPLPCPPFPKKRKRRMKSRKHYLLWLSNCFRLTAWKRKERYSS